MGISTANGYFGWAKQSGKGTGIAPAKYARFRTADDGIENELWDQFEGGVYRQGRFVEKVGVKCAPSFMGSCRADLAGWLFTMCLGDDTVSGAGPYVHTIIPANTPLWFSVEIGKLADLVATGEYTRFTDSVLDQLTVEGAAGKECTLAAGLLSLAYVSGSAATPTLSAEDVLFFRHGTFTMFGAASTEITDFSLVISNQAEAIQTNGLIYNDIALHNLDISLNFTLKVTSRDEYRKIYSGGSAGTAPMPTVEKSQVLLFFDNGGAGAASRKMEITLPSIAYSAGEMSGLNSDNEVAYIKCAGVSVRTGTSNLITAAITNGDSAAYDT